MNKIKYHFNIRIQWLQLHALFLVWPDKPWLESAFGKFNKLDMTWKGTPAYIRSHSWQCRSEQKPTHEVEGAACKAQRQGFCQDLGNATQMSAVSSSPRGTVSSIIIQWSVWMSEQPGLFVELANQPKRAIKGEGPRWKRWSRTWWPFQMSSGDPMLRWEKLPSTSPLMLAVLQNGRMEAFPLWKTHESCQESAKKRLMDSQTVGKKILWFD